MKNYVYILLISAFAFISCDDFDDINQSMALSGDWRGDFGMYYNYVDGRGRHYTFDSYDTRITFIPAYSQARHGRGTQVDYYEYGPYEYQYYKFTKINNYRMTNDYFSGTFSNTGTSFRLYKLADYYNWTPYVNVYGYGPRNDWDYGYPYYAPQTRSDVEATDSTSNAGEVVGRGRRQVLQQ